MSCDDLTAAHDALPAPTHPTAGAGVYADVKPIAARRRPGSALRQLEMLALDELRQMLDGRGQLAQSGGIDDLVWASVVWDMGLNGTAIAAAGTPQPLLARYAALSDDD